MPCWRRSWARSRLHCHSASQRRPQPSDCGSLASASAAGTGRRRPARRHAAGRHQLPSTRADGTHGAASRCATLAASPPAPREGARHAPTGHGRAEGAAGEAVPEQCWPLGSSRQVAWERPACLARCRRDGSSRPPPSGAAPVAVAGKVLSRCATVSAESPTVRCSLRPATAAAPPPPPPRRAFAPAPPRAAASAGENDAPTPVGRRRLRK